MTSTAAQWGRHGTPKSGLPAFGTKTSAPKNFGTKDVSKSATADFDERG
jgi:hypothetical protein